MDGWLDWEGMVGICDLHVVLFVPLGFFTRFPELAPARKCRVFCLLTELVDFILGMYNINKVPRVEV